ncbi:hypothetical protein [Archangium lipolyticum]|uniref:hypothetical protein n=1 Tax=Archangium lipolyticum TaxID=2970465 RepID=UPI002149C094|nr:hypothetical protein [Archangium lipolyticum]
MRAQCTSSVLLALLVSVSAYEGANAQPAPEPADAADPVSKVLKAPDPKAAFEALDAKEKADFNTRMEVSEVTVEEEKVEKIEALDAKAGAQACWKGQAKGKAKAVTGNTLFTYWVVGEWCASGGKVTSAKFSRGDGETKTPGWRYVGVEAKGGETVKGMARVWARHRFILGVGGIDVKTDDRCLRFTGNAKGKLKVEHKCDVF